MQLRKPLLGLVSALLIASTLAGCSSKASNTPDSGKKAPSFPEQGITLIVPFAAGGGTDQVARILGTLIETKTGKPVTVVNKTGGAGAVGFTEGAKAKPDGYTLVLVTSNISTVRVTGNSQLTYKDFSPIIAVNYDAPALIVRKDSPYDTWEKFLAAAKEKTLNVGTGSPGGLWHLGAIQLEKTAGIKLNIIPSATGGAPAATQLLGGHVDAIIIPPNEATAQIQSKDFKVLGAMAPDRNSLAPDAPTFKELGLDLDVRSLRGFLGPKDIPQDIINQLHDIFKAAMDDAKYQNYMKDTGSNIVYMNPADYTKYLEDELTTYEKLMVDAGLAKK